MPPQGFKHIVPRQTCDIPIYPLSLSCTIWQQIIPSIFQTFPMFHMTLDFRGQQIIPSISQTFPPHFHMTLDFKSAIFLGQNQMTTPTTPPSAVPGHLRLHCRPWGPESTLEDSPGLIIGELR